MKDSKAKERDEHAYTMALGHATLEQIRDRLGFRSVTSVEASIRRTMKTRERQIEFAADRILEITRVERMFTEAYSKAVKGDLRAMDTCVMLQEKRAALVDDNQVSELSDQYERTLEALELEESDSAAIEAGRTIVRQIDHTLQHGTPHERTKALYLIPHLMNVLRELGATPEVRKQLEGVGKQVAGTQEPSKLEVLQHRLKMKAV